MLETGFEGQNFHARQYGAMAHPMRRLVPVSYMRLGEVTDGCGDGDTVRMPCLYLQCVPKDKVTSDTLSMLSHSIYSGLVIESKVTSLPAPVLRCTVL